MEEEDFIVKCAIYEASFESERAERLALLEAITHRKQVFWCSFCLRATSALVRNKCFICKEEIPCAIWCSEENAKHVCSSPFFQKGK